jgi:hypothetical protein
MVASRVARWYNLIPNIQILVHFGRPWVGKLWCISRQVGGIFKVPFWYIYVFPFWFVVARKIWQSRSQRKKVLSM